jgi:hypothetical protein
MDKGTRRMRLSLPTLAGSEYLARKRQEKTLLEPPGDISKSFLSAREVHYETKEPHATHSKEPEDLFPEKMHV